MPADPIRFLVAEQVGQRVSLSLRNGEDVIHGRMESWALRTGLQYRFATLKLSEVMLPFVTEREPDGVILYDLPFDFAVDIVRAEMGPTDRECYELALRIRREHCEFTAQIRRKRRMAWLYKALLLGIFIGVVLLVMLFFAIRLLVFIIVFPLLINLLNRRP